jgi:hypothetical protein
LGEVLHQVPIIATVDTKHGNHGIGLPGERGKCCHRVRNPAVTLNLRSLHGVDNIKAKMADDEEFHGEE